MSVIPCSKDLMVMEQHEGILGKYSSIQEYLKKSMECEELPSDILPPTTDVPDEEAIARWWVVTTSGQEPSVALAFWTTTGGPMQGMGYVKDCTPGCKFHPGRWRSQTNTPFAPNRWENMSDATHVPNWTAFAPRKRERERESMPSASDTSASELREARELISDLHRSITAPYVANQVNMTSAQCSQADAIPFKPRGDDIANALLWQMS